jgi:hypothetical protein
MRNVIARVTVVGGHVSVHSEPGAGTRIDGWVPLPDQPTEAGEGEAAAAGEQSADGVSSAGKSASLITSADDTLVGKARDALREALTRYGDAPAAERVRQVLESLDEAPDIEATDAGPPLPPSRRIGILSGWTALRELDALVRSEPPDTGAASLLHRLERISSGAHELAEVDAIDALRPGEYSLTSDDVEHAARLLGEFGEDPCTRLGLPPGTDPSLVTAAAEQAMAVWRARASHPATMQRVRMLAATVVQSCEHQLALNALPAVVPVDADSRFVRSRSTSSGSGAAGVAVPGAERRHPRWTDSAGVGWCRVVAQERQGDVPVEAGEQLQHRRVVDLHDRPSWFSTSRWFPISLPDHGSAPAARPATARVGPAAASAGARAGGSRPAGTRRKRQTRPTHPAAAWQPRHASLTAVQQVSAEPEAAASAGEPAGDVQQPVAQGLGFDAGQRGVVQEQGLGVGEQVDGDHGGGQPGRVDAEAAAGQQAQPGVAAAADASSTRAWARCRASSQACCPVGVSMARAV